MVLVPFGSGRRSLLLVAVVAVVTFLFFYSTPPRLTGYGYGSGYGAQEQQSTGQTASGGSSQEQKVAPPPAPAAPAAPNPKPPAPKPPAPPDAPAETPLPPPPKGPEPAHNYAVPSASYGPSPVFTAPSSPQQSTASKKTNKFLVVLGDSYSWTGFNIEKAWPSRENPIGNPKYPGMTLSHGATWVGHLATKYNSTFLYNFNLAFAGATTDNSIVDAGKFRDMKEQVTRDYIGFLVKQPEKISWTPEETVMGICMGINDIARTWGAPIAEFKKLQPKLMDSFWKSVELIYDTGVRQFFVMNIPPLQSAPDVINDKNKARSPQWKLYEEFYNQELDRRTKVFQAEHPDVIITNFDHHGVYARALANPQTYGFVNNNTSGDVKDHIWADGFHAGSVMHELIAKDLADHLRTVGIQV